MREVLPLELADHGAVAALAHVEHGIVGDVFHEAHAPRAENAAVRRVHHVAAEVLDRIEALGVAIASLAAPFHVRVVLQLALTRLIADRAIERVVDEQHLEDAFARLDRLLGVHVDDVPLGHGRRARRGELGRLLDLDEAHAAHAGDRQPRMVAVVRHEHARALCRLEDGGARGDGDLPSLDRERYAHRCVCH